MMCRPSFFVIFKGLKGIYRIQKEIMSTLADLSTVVAKIGADIDAFVAADQAKDAKIADLQSQLDALKNDANVIDAAVASLTNSDAKLALPPAP
jgi:hypothetical protein